MRRHTAAADQLQRPHRLRRCRRQQTARVADAVLRSQLRRVPARNHVRRLVRRSARRGHHDQDPLDAAVSRHLSSAKHGYSAVKHRACGRMLPGQSGQRFASCPDPPAGERILPPPALRESGFTPIGLCLLDPLGRGGDEVPIDVPGSEKGSPPISISRAE